MWKGNISTKKLMTPITNLSKFVDEAYIEVKEDGLYCSTPDIAMVCVLNIKIPKDEFNSYEYVKDEVIRLQTTNFFDVLKRFKENINIELLEDKMIVYTKERRFTIPLLDMEKPETPDVSKIEYSVKAKIKSDVFRTSINDALAIGSDVFVIRTENGKLIFSSGGNYVKSCETEVDSNLSYTNNYKSRYPIDYLNKLKIDTEEMTIEFGKDNPLKISDDNTEFILAPRVEEDEGEENG